MKRYRVVVVLAGVTIGALALALSSSASSVASTPDRLVAKPRAAAVDPIVREWSSKWEHGVVTINVTGSGGNYVGNVVQDNSGASCNSPAGKLIWTIRGSAPNYTGTASAHPGCANPAVAAFFTVSTYNGGLWLDVRVGTNSESFEGGPAPVATAPDPTAPDTTPPTVRLDAESGIIRIGEKFRVRWSVTDNSKKAKVTLTLYSGGDVVATQTSRGLVKATGQVREGTADAGSRYPGPFYICVSAVDAAGNTSATPGPKCEWLSVQVPVSRVSNGCGGAQWGPGAEAVQNWLLDTQKYNKETVNFRAACNQHDAGYAGVTVADPFLKHVVDFRTWSRERVDKKLEKDMQTLCHKYLDGNVSPNAISSCTKGVSQALLPAAVVVGGPPGALAYYEGVRQYAKAAFDTNVVAPGTQTDNNPSTWPLGGGRDNT
ncbi:MAG: hypothetical protein Q7L55_05885 [Actinomycetota bacterium]|nr:hypothetical protein [Actinomycetota bacterium]